MKLIIAVLIFLSLGTASSQSYELVPTHDQPIPSEIIIYGKIWQIATVLDIKIPEVQKQQISRDEVVAGMTYCAKNMIEIVSDENISVERQTVLHEILHAAACTLGKDAKYYNSTDGTPHGHEGFNNITMVILEVIWSNPQLEKYLFKN